MRAHDQCSIFSTGGKFRPHYGLLLELHALTLVARSYALLWELRRMGGGRGGGVGGKGVVEEGEKEKGKEGGRQ